MSERVGEPCSRRLDPQDAVAFDRRVAAGALRPQRIGAERRRQLAQRKKFTVIDRWPKSSYRLRRHHFEPGREIRALIVREMQPVFRSPLENVFGLHRPFLFRKEARLTLIKRPAEQTPQVADRLGAIQEALDPRTISPGIAARDFLRQPGTPPTQLLKKKEKSAPGMSPPGKGARSVHAPDIWESRAKAFPERAPQACDRW